MKYNNSNYWYDTSLQQLKFYNTLSQTEILHQPLSKITSSKNKKANYLENSFYWKLSLCRKYLNLEQL